MHLPDRCGGKWFGVDRLKVTLVVVAELISERFADLLDIVRSHVGAQTLEFLAEAGADEVGTRGQPLTELDERRAEVR